MDILKFFYNKINAFDSVEKKTFFILFIFGNLLYSFQAYNDLIGYHNFVGMMELKPMVLGLGRFTMHWFYYLTYFVSIPLLANMLCIFPLALGSIFMAKLWNTQKSVTAYSLIGLFLIATPHTISWIYYSSLANFYIFAFIPAALLLLQKKSIVRFILASFLIYVSFGVYQAAANTLAIIFIGMLVGDFLQGNFCKEKIKKYLYIILGCINGLAIYCAVLLYYKKVDTHGWYTVGHFMVQSAKSPLERLAAIPDLIIDALQYFINFQPYFELDYRLPIIIICALAIISILFQVVNKLKISQNGVTSYLSSLFLVLGCTVFLLLSTNLTAFFHGLNYAQEPRIYLYGYIPLVLLAISYICSSPFINIKNIGVVCIIFLLYVSTANTLMFQKNWKRSSDLELGYIARIADRIEQNDVYSPEKEYIVYTMGATPKHFNKIYNGASKFEDVIPYTTSINAYTASVLSYVAPTINIPQAWELRDWSAATLDDASKTKQKIKEYLQEAKPWPAKSAVQIIDNIIVIIWDKKGLEVEKEKLGIN